MTNEVQSFTRLDLGAGTVDRVPGALRGDISKDVKPDIVLNAENTLPLRTDTLEEVHCYDLVEHIANLPNLMTEIHRVLKSGGTVTITTPHFSCANSYTDPTHVRHMGWHSFDYFTEEHDLKYYSRARFNIKRRVLRFHGGVIDAIIRRLAARWPDFYEHRLAWIFPAWYLEFELTAEK
ncbi:MAG: class I SAM-dependent methyltransferase [Gemmatimonadota bacterium]|nr:class I SAM-dependent methyltransferase [Gemmatimonadota bacterium]